MTDVRFTDYVWIGDAGALFQEGFALTVIADASIDEVLTGWTKPTSSTRGGYDDLVNLANSRSFIAVGGLLETQGAVVLYEPNGYLDAGDRPLRRALSMGRTIVTIDANMAASYFYLFREGALVTAFERMFAYDRSGAEPDALLDLMIRIGGFDLDPDLDEDLTIESDHLPASYALCEALTGVKLTRSLLSESDYLICQF